MLDPIGLAAATSFLLGVLLAWLRIVPPLVGFVLFALGGLIGLIVGLIAVVRAARGRRMSRGGLAGAAIGVLFLVAAARGFGYPRINDFTTDLVDPPAFRHAASLPANAGRDLSYPIAFADTQRACCADLRPASVPGAPHEALARARAVAERMPGWKVTEVDVAQGTVEAVVTSRLFGFADDVVIRVRPKAGGGSRVDMRSKSRDGQGDLGVNAARIRTFVAALEAPGNGGS